MKQGEPVPVVKVGQIWEAYEAHHATRMLHVLELVDRGQFGQREPGARCHVIHSGRKVIVALRRMKPGRTRGYRMVADAP